MNQRDQNSLTRILDAAANRAAEAIRVVEDFVRFGLNDPLLTKECKQLRHDLTTILEVLDTSERHAARETTADVGTKLATPAEYQRANMDMVVTANFKRFEQSMRSLEEYAKILVPEVAAKLEPLRYRAYTLERAVGISIFSQQQLKNARLCILIDGGESEDAFVELVEQLVWMGAILLQLRDKRLDDQTLLQRARLMRRLTHQTPTLMIVNDRPDIAALSNADGVHLGQDDLPIKDARAIIGPKPLIGVSTHSLEQAKTAVLEGANFLGVGPVFPSKTKQFDQFPGLELLQAIDQEIGLPAFAIGGITQDNLPQVLATGCHRVAISNAITAAPKPDTTTEAILALLRRADETETEQA